MAAQFAAPVLLSTEHDLSSFDCGEPVLNDWFLGRALPNQALNASRTYVLCRRGESVVAGYYSLAAGSVERQIAPGSIRRNMPDPVPVVVLGRLAVDAGFQGSGLGGILMRNAIRRVLQVSSEVAVKALLVHAISPEAHQFYQGYGFIESEADEMTLFLPVATMATSLE